MGTQKPRLSGARPEGSTQSVKCKLINGRLNLQLIVDHDLPVSMAFEVQRRGQTQVVDSHLKAQHGVRLTVSVDRWDCQDWGQWGEEKNPPPRS